MTTNYLSYQDYQRRIADINYSGAVLQWDMEVYMPVKGGDIRSRQISTLSGLAHEMATSEEYGHLLQNLLSGDLLSEKERRNIEESFKDFKRQKKYSRDFVEKLSLTISEAVQVWTRAKQASDFSLFSASLEKLVELKRQECEIIGYDDQPYDALLDQYEPGVKTIEIDSLFAGVKEWLVDFVRKIASNRQNENSFMFGNFPRDRQWEFGLFLLKQMGYDLEAGRQDISAHPFSISFNPLDVRVTTRINEHDLNEMIWSCIHEGGHALYEQGFSPEDYGLPSAEAVSLGIHESQSRLWENCIGRGISYWKANYVRLQELFPSELQKVSLEDFYKAMNVVQPSLVRTNADELTYHFHILIRFELEKALIEKSIRVDDLPAAWNEKYAQYLGIKAENDAEGVLQDIHWSYGNFGYFPTYSLGSFYAAQFYAKAKKDIPDFIPGIESGNMKPLLGWLRKNIHIYGKRYTAGDLCKRVTGEKLNFKYFKDYAVEKYSALYNL